MATLVSPGTSVTIINESFYIPSSAPTVPLLFVATQANKTQPDGSTPAGGTQEHDIVRTVTSIGQSVQLYGIPNFIKDTSGNQFNGDARNEYGLFALNQYLNVGNVAYVVRANVDLSDTASSFIGAGTPVVSTITSQAFGNGTISTPTVPSALVHLETFTVIFNDATTFTVEGSVSGIVGTGGVGTAFASSKINFTITAGSTPFAGNDYFEFSTVYPGPAPTVSAGGNGFMSNISLGSAAVAETINVAFTSPTAFTVTGSVSGALGTGTVGTAYADTTNHISFLISPATTSPVAFTTGDTFQVTLTSINLFNPLGANDAAKRVAISTALRAAVNLNSDVRSETYEYNLILCPGYPEVVESLLALSTAVFDEAFVIADTPANFTPEQTTAWANTSNRANSTSVAYYYPWIQASNLDGTLVVAAASGTALSTYAYSDNQSYVWFAPAGVRRGAVIGVNSVGYVSGALGTATTFVEVNLNQGQRDVLYQSYSNINPIVYFPGRGIIVWGQKTSPAAASALDRVNVARLLMYIKRQLRKNSMPFIFEPNDQITRDNLKSSADSFLNQVMAQRGLYDFVTLCNSSNNTPQVIDNNELVMAVGLKPTKAVEFIYIPITVYTTGASLP